MFFVFDDRLVVPTRCRRFRRQRTWGAIIHPAGPGFLSRRLSTAQQRQSRNFNRYKVFVSFSDGALDFHSFLRFARGLSLCAEVFVAIYPVRVFSVQLVCWLMRTDPLPRATKAPEPSQRMCDHRRRGMPKRFVVLGEEGSDSPSPPHDRSILLAFCRGCPPAVTARAPSWAVAPAASRRFAV